jgi:hypothetical protein
MHAERTGASTLSTTPPDQDDTITVARDPDDPRTDRVALSKVWHPIMTERTGGLRTSLAEPLLGVRAWCSDVPNVAHDCTHGDGPHRILVLLPEAENEPAVYQRLRAIAEFNSTQEGRRAVKRAARLRRLARRREMRDGRRRAAQEAPPGMGTMSSPTAGMAHA